MKYIKFDDHIYKVTRVTTKDVYLEGHDPIPLTTKKKIANTIEDLLNRYIVTKTGHYKIYTRLKFKKQSVKQILQQGYEIYGAIWTKSGLTYAARILEERTELLWKLKLN